MIKVKGSLNIDRLKVCFKSNDYVINRLQEQFRESGNTLDYVDFRLVRIDERDKDSLSVAVDMDIDNRSASLRALQVLLDRGCIAVMRSSLSRIRHFTPRS